ncbi:MAG: phosphatase PAP2 family protein [Actinomycetales bacterium]
MSGVAVAAGRISWFWWPSCAGLVVTLLTYLFTTFTVQGQAIVDEAWLDRVAEGRGWLRASRHLLEFIDVGTVVGVLVALLVVTGVRGRWPMGAALGGGLLMAVASAEVLKVVLPRPDLAPKLEAMMGEHAANSFPSGHVTIVTASVLAALVVLPAQARLRLALLGGVLVAAVSCAVVAAGWHRPSDALGGLGWGLAVQGLVVAVVLWRFGAQNRPGTRVRWFWPACVGVMVILVVLLLGALGTGPAWPGAFALAEVALATAAVLAIGWTAWLLRNMEVS